MKSAMPSAAGGGTSRTSDFLHQDESAILELLQNLEQRHGFVPREVSDEISRLVGRALRGVVDVSALGENTVVLDDTEPRGFADVVIS